MIVREVGLQTRTGEKVQPSKRSGPKERGSGVDRRVSAAGRGSLLLYRRTSTMADFIAGEAPVTTQKSPAPSEYRDSPYQAVLMEAQGSLMEKVTIDVGHVVNALEQICGVSGAGCVRQAPFL